MADMPGMDHSRMTPERTAQPGAAHDHAAMSGMGSMPGMTSSNAAPPVENSDATLVAIAAQLVKDSVVQRLIAADSTLRRQWADPVVRRMLGMPSEK
jgi:hypothetical protein